MDCRISPAMTTVTVAPLSSGHFLLQNLGEAVEKVLRRNFAEDGLLDQRHAVGIDLAAPAWISEIGADDADLEGLHEAVQRRVFREFRLRDDRLARRQQP